MKNDIFSNLKKGNFFYQIPDNIVIQLSYSSYCRLFVFLFRMQMNFGEDGMDFSDPNIDIMQNIDVSKFMEDYLNSSSGNPPGSF